LKLFFPNITCRTWNRKKRPNVHLINVPCTCTKISLQIRGTVFITIPFSWHLGEINLSYKYIAWQCFLLSIEGKDNPQLYKLNNFKLRPTSVVVWDFLFWLPVDVARRASIEFICCCNWVISLSNLELRK